MAEKQKPLKVLATHAYPAYQFVADFEYRDHDGDACFRYLILHILDWVCQRTEDDILIKSLGLPSQPDPDEAGESCFQSVHVADAYKLDICALMAEGIWSMRLAEPDMDRAERRAVVGRSFVTNVGLTRKAPDSRLVTCGIRIDVLDPENAPEEVPFAYRPAFLRTLFIKGRARCASRRLAILSGGKRSGWKRRIPCGMFWRCRTGPIRFSLPWSSRRHSITGKSRMSSRI